MRQLLTESVVLALLAGSLGVFLADQSVRALIAFGPTNLSRLDETGLDVGVLVFTLGVSSLAAIIFGLVPALSLSRRDPNEALKSGGRGSSASVAVRRTRGLLAATEVALSVVLLTGAGLLIRSFLAIQAVDPGFQPQNVLTMRVLLPAAAPEAQRAAFYEKVLEKVETLPGVQSAGSIDGLFALGAPGTLGLRTVEGRVPEPRGQWTALTWKTIRGNYLQAMGASLVKGRFFSESDSSGSPLVAIIDEGAARRYWPGGDPIGKRFKGQDARGRIDDWLTVVGVVRDMHRHGLERQPTPHVFEWHSQSGGVTPDLVVRTTGKPAKSAAALRDAVRSLDPAAIVSNVTTLERQLSDQMSPRRFQTWLLALFSMVALLLDDCGCLQRHALLGGPADPRDWNSNGIGCSTWQRAAFGARSGTAIDPCRLGRRSGRRVLGEPDSFDAAFWRNGNRPCHVHRCFPSSRRRGAIGNLHSRSASCKSRSDGGA